MIKLRTKNILYFFLLMTVFFSLLIIPSLFPMRTQEEKIDIQQHNNARSQTSTTLSIFSNNFIVSAITMIPGFGWGYILYVLLNTGIVVSSYDTPAWLILLNPFAWIELSIYSFAVLWSIKLYYMARNRKRPQYFQSLVAYTFLGLAVTAGFLLLSAFIEYSVISGVKV